MGRERIPFNDADYLKSLSEKDRAWYLSFTAEYYGRYLNNPKFPSIHPPSLHKAITDSDNARRRDLYNLQDSMGPLHTKEEESEEHYAIPIREPQPNSQSKRLKPWRLAKSGRNSKLPKPEGRRLKPTKRKSKKQPRYGGLTLRSLKKLVGQIVNLVYVQDTLIAPGIALRTFPKVMIRREADYIILSVTDKSAYLEERNELGEWEKKKVTPKFVKAMIAISKMIDEGQLLPSDYGVQRAYG